MSDDIENEEDNDIQRCHKCHGSGVVYVYTDDNGDEHESDFPLICTVCGGYGRFD